LQRFRRAGREVLPMRRAAVLIVMLALSGCGTWVRPGTPPQVANMDTARCRLMARQMDPVPDTPPVHNKYEAIGAGLGLLGTALSQAGDFRDCMQASGYTLVQQADAAPTPMSPAGFTAAAPAPETAGLIVSPN
jgi:hypothetical protein